MHLIFQLIFRNFIAHPDNIRLKTQTPIIKEYLKNRNKLLCWTIDIGCGTGRYTRFLLGISNFVVCIDPNPEMIKRVKKKYRSQTYCNIPLLVQGKVERLPFKRGVFDIALLLEVLEHIQDDQKGLSEVNQILKKDGKLILSTPHPPPVYLDRFHKRVGYTKEEIFELLNNTGFKVLSYKFCMFWISRVILRFAVNFISMFKIPPPILFLLIFECFFKKPPPFDIIIKAKK
jgi:ubiquinone/menaquinone biosynthesis C-methylase UbiE